jgi:hypothetical protein
MTTTGRVSASATRALLVSSVLVLAALAFGQTSWGQTTAPQSDAVPPAGTLESPPEKVEPERPIGDATPGGDKGTLSEQLQRSGGVIQPPPARDPGMTIDPPNEGAAQTPVIPPPGTPGGAPGPTPK